MIYMTLGIFFINSKYEGNIITRMATAVHFAIKSFTSGETVDQSDNPTAAEKIVTLGFAVFML